MNIFDLLKLQSDLAAVFVGAGVQVDKAQKLAQDAADLFFTSSLCDKECREFYENLDKKPAEEEKFIVRLWDGMDGVWCDITEPLPKGEAEKVLADKTGNGTHHRNFNDIDYYRIFPADTKILYDSSYPMIDRQDEDND